MKIPVESLSIDALKGLIETFVLREGTDYGHRDISLEEKTRAVRRALQTGEAIIVYDPETATTNIVTTP
ncbi:MAG: YheU family protein [Proteobacteria bacterium]|nr:YheU family protein [Pseudomonadota bacterium]